MPCLALQAPYFVHLRGVATVAACLSTPPVVRDPGYSASGLLRSACLPGIYGVLFVDTIFVDTFESKFEAAMRKSMTGLGMLQQERR